MSKNIKQVYDTNPITSNTSTDLMYFGQSPYGNTDDAAMLFSDFAAQFGVTPQDIQNQSFTYTGVDSGTPDNYVISLTPAITSYEDGMQISFLAANTNATTSPVIDIDGLGNVPIIAYGSSVAPLGAIPSAKPSNLQYSSTANAFILLNPELSTVAVTPSSLQLMTNLIVNSVGGSANAITGTLNPSVSFILNGTTIILQPTSNNTGATTLDVGGIVGASSIKKMTKAGLANLAVDDLISGGKYFLMFTGAPFGQWIVLNPTLV